MKGNGDTAPVRVNVSLVASTLSAQTKSVAPESSGNVIVTGWFSGTVDFGGGNLTSSAADIFVAKYAAVGGTHLWSKKFGAEHFDEGLGVAVAGSGSLFLTGDFQDTVDFGGGGLTSAGQADIFLVKLLR